MSDPFYVACGYVPTVKSGNTPVAMTVAATDYVIVSATPSRQRLSVSNNSSAVLWLTEDGTPAVSGGVFTGIQVAPGATYVRETKVPLGAIHAASSLASPAYYVVEG